VKTLKSTKEYIKRRQKKQEKNRRRSKAKKRLRKRARENRRNIVFRLHKTIMQYFPDLFDKFREIEDYRKKRNYELAELIMACIAMFLFKEGSRNAFNNEREEDKFRKNYERIFKVQLPHMDTVDLVMRELSEEQLEELKTELVRVLIEKKVFYKYRFLGKYYKVVIDGTHVMDVKKGHCNSCLHRTSKNGKVTYFHNVLEAKLVCENGFCVSLCTEWIENAVGDFNKQDCELKAFLRLAEKLKKDYPRLPICIIADGLYPNRTFFGICRKYSWKWIVTFKNGNLPSVWKEVLELQKIAIQNTKERVTTWGEKGIHRVYNWVNDIDYQGFKLNWFECVEEVDNETTRFVYISSLNVDYDNILDITISGRIRWKIENEGFDIQKNHGYGLGHKYSRKYMQATKNYYQCMQIAHIFNQLLELSSIFKPLLTGKMTIKHLWNCMLGEMRDLLLDIEELALFLSHRVQFRYG
jgi:hypothetical protein